jgi:hypothetical protein
MFASTDEGEPGLTIKRPGLTLLKVHPTSATTRAHFTNRSGEGTMTTAQRTTTTDRTQRDGATRLLLGAGAAAGVLYTAIGVLQLIFRDGVDPRKHALSLLSNGSYGWIQIANFLLAGGLLICGAAGVRRAFTAGPGSVWGPRLLAAYGVSLVLAGLFRADPALGFPPGTPDGPMPISWHGYVHFAVGTVGFSAFIAACLVVARRQSRSGDRGQAWFSRVTAVVFLAGFVGISSGSAGPASLAFYASVTLGWAWITLLCRRLAA